MFIIGIALPFSAHPEPLASLMPGERQRDGVSFCPPSTPCAHERALFDTDDLHIRVMHVLHTWLAHCTCAVTASDTLRYVLPDTQREPYGYNVTARVKECMTDFIHTSTTCRKHRCHVYARHSICLMSHCACCHWLYMLDAQYCYVCTVRPQCACQYVFAHYKTALLFRTAYRTA